MVMVSARLTRRWRLSYRHDLTNAVMRLAHIFAAGDLTAWLTMQSAAN
jgi:hypothetical protein